MSTPTYVCGHGGCNEIAVMVVFEGQVNNVDGEHDCCAEHLCGIEVTPMDPRRKDTP